MPRNILISIRKLGALYLTLPRDTHANTIPLLAPRCYIHLRWFLFFYSLKNGFIKQYYTKTSQNIDSKKILRDKGYEMHMQISCQLTIEFWMNKCVLPISLPDHGTIQLQCLQILQKHNSYIICLLLFFQSFKVAKKHFLSLHLRRPVVVLDIPILKSLLLLLTMNRCYIQTLTEC